MLYVDNMKNVSTETTDLNEISVLSHVLIFLSLAMVEKFVVWFELHVLWHSDVHCHELNNYICYFIWTALAVWRLSYIFLQMSPEIKITVTKIKGSRKPESLLVVLSWNNFCSFSMELSAVCAVPLCCRKLSYCLFSGVSWRNSLLLMHWTEFKICWKKW